VETPEELAFLSAHQCDEGQGYHFGRPMAPEQFAALLQSGIPEALRATPEAGRVDVAEPVAAPAAP
jgi:hypothetical protein